VRALGGPLRILLICDAYPPVLGGSEIEAQRVCAGLLRRGHQVTVVTCGGDPMPPVRRWTDPKGVPVRLLAGRWTGTRKHYVFALEVARLLWRERRNYDFAYFLMQGLHLASGLPVAKLLGKLIVMKIGGSGVVPLMQRSRAGRLELRWLKQWAHRVMILNEGMREEAIADGFPPGKLVWMPNPVDTQEFAPLKPHERAALRQRLRIPCEARVVVFCGRLAPEKALPSLLEAFGRAATELPDALLLVVGDGPLRGELEQQAARLGLGGNRLRFAGRVPADEVPSWLQAADLFALVSVSEGFPCALVEAMSAGLASVVSDIPANRQLVEDGIQGRLVPVGDVTAIAGAMEHLLSDAACRFRMAGAARERVLDNYSTDGVVERYETMLRGVERERRS
jgi:glycosyltransferase involved in cell wall biosynthesis